MVPKGSCASTDLHDRTRVTVALSSSVTDVALTAATDLPLALSYRAMNNKQELIAEAKAGDRSSLERLLLTVYADLQRHVELRMPRGAASFDSEDVVQRAFTQAFLKVESFAGADEAAFFKWLKVIAEHQHNDMIRAAKRLKRGGQFQQVKETDSAQHLLDALAVDSVTASRLISRDEATKALQSCLADLPENYQNAIRLRYFDQQTVAQIADSLDMTEGAVRGVLDRARKKLREAMGRASQWLSRG